MRLLHSATQTLNPPGRDYGESKTPLSDKFIPKTNYALCGKEAHVLIEVAEIIGDTLGTDGLTTKRRATN